MKRDDRAHRPARSTAWRSTAARTRIRRRPALRFLRTLACLQFAPDRLDPGGVLALGRHCIYFPGLFGLPLGAGVTLERGHPGNAAFMDLLHLGHGWQG